MNNVFIDSSAITQDTLSHIRDKTTNIAIFRAYADRISLQLLSFALRLATPTTREIATPLEKIQAPFLPDNFVFVTILRAGLAMLPAALQLLPLVPVGFLGLKRDEQTAIAKEYYYNVPTIGKDTTVIVGDPMLATGGSMLHTLERIAAFTPKEILVVSVICAPEGITKIQEKFPDIKIFTAAVDSHLNDKKYIVPGLGDFGDRYFGTENL